MSTLRVHADEFRTPWERNFALLLLCLAVAARFAFPEWIEFRGDERAALLRTRELLEQGQWLHGLTASNGLVMGPILLYLLAPVVAFTHDPVWITAWVMFCNLGALAALFVLLRRGFGARLAVLGTAYFAALPIGTLFARRLWAPDLLLPFTLPLCYVLVRLSREYSRSWLLCATALYALAAQIHPSVWFLAPGLGLACLLLRIRPPLRDLAQAGLLTLLLCLPWLLYEWRIDFDDLRGYLHLREGSPALAPGFWLRLGQHWNVDLELASSAGLGELLGQRRMELVRGSWPGALACALALALKCVCAVATLACALRAARALAARRRGRAITTGESVLLLFCCMLVATSPIYALLGVLPELHYHVLLMPAVAGFLLVWCADLLRAVRGSWLTCTLSLLILLQLVLAAEVRRASLIQGAEGLFQPLTAEALADLRARLPADVDAELARAALFEQAQLPLERRFSASSRPLWRLDLGQNGRTVYGSGRVELTYSQAGLLVRGSSPKDMLHLPEFPPPTSGSAILRLELEAPTPQSLYVFYSRPGELELSRTRVVGIWVPAGRRTLFVELPDPRACGPLALRSLAYRYVVYAAEVREVER